MEHYCALSSIIYMMGFVMVFEGTHHRKRLERRIRVAVHIDAGPRFTMGKLNIVGLDLNGEFEIKRIWTMKEGGPFNADYPDSFLTRVREEGLFERHPDLED